MPTSEPVRWHFDLLGQTFVAEHDIGNGTLWISTRRDGIHWLVCAPVGDEPIRPIAMARAALMIRRVRDWRGPRRVRTASLEELTGRLRALKGRMERLRKAEADY